MGGEFVNVGGVSSPHIARWDGSSWSSFEGSVPLPVWELTALGTDLYLGGSFTSSGWEVPSFRREGSVPPTWRSGPSRAPWG